MMIIYKTLKCIFINMLQLRVLVLLALSMSSLNSFADSTPIKMVWDKIPLDIVLPVGKQRLVSFPDKVAFALPSSMKSLLNIQNDNKTLYITATKAFPVRQFIVKTSSNKVIIINLSASINASQQMIDVIFPVIGKNIDHTANNKVSLKSLLRYSMQYFYAPDRLKMPINGISKSAEFSTKKYDLFTSGEVNATPLFSFTGGGLTVTAIYLKNAIAIPVDLNPTEICGKWKSSSFFPQSKLTPSGTKYDSSMLFLVSSNDFISQFNGTCGVGV